MQVRISAITEKALKAWRWDNNDINFIKYLIFCEILTLIDRKMFIVLSIFSLALKIYVNNYYVMNIELMYVNLKTLHTVGLITI